MTELNSGLYVHTYSSLAQSALLLTFSRSSRRSFFCGLRVSPTVSSFYSPELSLRRILDTKQMASHKYFRSGLFNSVAIERRHSHSYVK